MRKKGDIEPNTFMMKWSRWCEIAHPVRRAFERLHTSDEMRKEIGSPAASRYIDTFSQEEQRNIAEVLNFLIKFDFNWDDTRNKIYAWTEEKDFSVSPSTEENQGFSVFPYDDVWQKMKAEDKKTDAEQPLTQHAEWKFPFIKVAVVLFLFSMLLKFFIFLF